MGTAIRNGQRLAFISDLCFGGFGHFGLFSSHFLNNLLWNSFFQKHLVVILYISWDPKDYETWMHCCFKRQVVSPNQFLDDQISLQSTKFSERSFDTNCLDQVRKILQTLSRHVLQAIGWWMVSWLWWWIVMAYVSLIIGWHLKVRLESKLLTLPICGEWTLSGMLLMKNSN